MLNGTKKEKKSWHEFNESGKREEYLPFLEAKKWFCTFLYRLPFTVFRPYRKEETHL